MIIRDESKLRGKCVDTNKNEVDELVSLLEFELDKSNERGNPGVGLAAPQIGINKNVAIVRIGDTKINLVNCSISKGFGSMILEEGCLSLPGKTCLIERHEQLNIVDNELGFPKKFSVFGLPAAIVSHEMDHWDGILISDKKIDTRLNIAVNQKCPCGSGLRYKKCCKRKPK